MNSSLVHGDRNVWQAMQETQKSKNWKLTAHWAACYHEALCSPCRTLVGDEFQVEGGCVRGDHRKFLVQLISKATRETSLWRAVRCAVGQATASIQGILQSKNKDNRAWDELRHVWHDSASYCGARGC
jgi:hypothetical protein